MILSFCSSRSATCVFAFLLFPLAVSAEDWPQWRGPRRDGISAEKGWQSCWPASGPKKLWTAKTGIGYSSMAVSDGKLYTMGNTADVDRISCFDAETGNLVWKHEYTCPAKDPNDFPGP